MSVIRFEVPLPPPSLRANSRAHWATKKRDADEYSEMVYDAWLSHENAVMEAGREKPIMASTCQRANATYTWRYAGTAPDHSNLGGHTKYLQDILCMAPKNAKPGYKRWHLGLVEDDKGITAEYRMEKVAHKSQECVVVELREGALQAVEEAIR